MNGTEHGNNSVMLLDFKDGKIPISLINNKCTDLYMYVKRISASADMLSDLVCFKFLGLYFMTKNGFLYGAVFSTYCSD
jgi:hypothetical protein